MRNLPPHPADLVSQLKHLVADLFRLDLDDPEEISDHESLVGGSLDLDSTDLLELALCIEEMFGLTILRRDLSPRLFSSIASLANFIAANTLRNPRFAAATQPVQTFSPRLASATQG